MGDYKDYENYVFERLTGRLKHYCPDWDGMAINESKPEFGVCTCDFTGWEQRKASPSSARREG